MRRTIRIGFAVVIGLGWLAIQPGLAQDAPEKPAKPEKPDKPRKGDKPAGKDELPRAEKILDGFVEATGGAKAYEKVKSRVTRGTVTMGEMGMMGKIETWQQAPGKYYSKVTLGELGTTESGYDGTTAWQITMGTARRLSGAERAFFVREATFNGDLKWRDLTKSVETVGVEDVNEKPAYKIKAVTSDGYAMYLYYDKYSGLLVRVDARVLTELGSVDVEVYPSDYKEVDGILVPHLINQRMIGLVQTVKVDSVEFNVKVPPDKFKIPKAVRQIKDDGQPGANAGGQGGKPPRRKGP